MDRVWRHIVRLVVLSGLLVMHGNTVWADEPSPRERHSPCDSSLDAGSTQGGLQGLQIETNDIAAYERFFSDVLHAAVVQHIDHPQIDMLRGYCYRDVLIVVRQDVRSPRPTGWIQINFSVSDVAAVQRELEQALQESGLEQKSEEQKKIVRLRFKPDVARHNCRASRLEVGGPEGFMLGFDQFKETACSLDDRQAPRGSERPK